MKYYPRRQVEVEVLELVTGVYKGSPCSANLCPKLIAYLESKGMTNAEEVAMNINVQWSHSSSNAGHLVKHIIHALYAEGMYESISEFKSGQDLC